MRPTNNSGLTYILRGLVPVPEPVHSEWKRWMDEKGNNLKYTLSGHPFRKDLTVGVRFLGKENGLDSEGFPLLWMVAAFKGGICQKVEYYPSLKAVTKKLTSVVGWRQFMKFKLMGWIFEHYMLLQVRKMERKFEGILG